MDANPPLTHRDPSEGYRRWAFVLVALLMLVVIVAGVLVLGSVPIPAGQLPTLLVGTIPIFAVLAALLYGLNARLPWALAAVAPVCAILIVFGIVKVIMALGQNNITIPLEAIGAAFVLSRRPPASQRPTISAADTGVVAVLVGVFLFAEIWPFVPLRF